MKPLATLCLVALLAACGSADDPPAGTPPAANPPDRRPSPIVICVDTSTGRKVTYDCSETSQ